MDGFTIAGPIFMNVCIGASWEESVAFEAAHLAAQKNSITRQIKQLKALDGDYTKKSKVTK